MASQRIPTAEGMCATCEKPFDYGLAERTKGHVRPSCGKNPKGPRYYINQCKRCNTWQGRKTLTGWREYLVLEGGHDTLVLSIDRLIEQIKSEGIDEAFI